MEEQNAMPAPVFEAVPGWGGKIKKWLKKNFSGKILPVLAVLVLLAGIAKYLSRPVGESAEKLSLEMKAKIISLTVQSGEGIIATSRRALDEYLKHFPEVKLKPEQKLYIDNYFKEKFKGVSWKTGTEAEFLKEEIKQAVDEALVLSETKLDKFRQYLK